jgi:hypothetical protein
VQNLAWHFPREEKSSWQDEVGVRQYLKSVGTDVVKKHVCDYSSGDVLSFGMINRTPEPQTLALRGRNARLAYSKPANVWLAAQWPQVRAHPQLGSWAKLATLKRRCPRRWPETLRPVPVPQSSAARHKQRLPRHQRLGSVPMLPSAASITPLLVSFCFITSSLGPGRPHASHMTASARVYPCFEFIVGGLVTGAVCPLETSASAATIESHLTAGSIQSALQKRNIAHEVARDPRLPRKEHPTDLYMNDTIRIPIIYRLNTRN